MWGPVLFFLTYSEKFVECFENIFYCRYLIIFLKKESYLKKDLCAGSVLGQFTRFPRNVPTYLSLLFFLLENQKYRYYAPSSYKLSNKIPLSHFISDKKIKEIDKVAHPRQDKFCRKGAELNINCLWVVYWYRVRTFREQTKIFISDYYQ